MAKIRFNYPEHIGNKWKGLETKARNLSSYFHSAADLARSDRRDAYGLKQSVRVHAFTCQC